MPGHRIIKNAINEDFDQKCSNNVKEEIWIKIKREISKNNK